MDKKPLILAILSLAIVSISSPLIAGSSDKEVGAKEFIAKETLARQILTQVNLELSAGSGTKDQAGSADCEKMCRAADSDWDAFAACVTICEADQALTRRSRKQRFTSYGNEQFSDAVPTE